MSKEFDDVNNPSHYQGIRVTLRPVDITRQLPGPLSNAVKYVWRAGQKAGTPGSKDLAKAMWYLQDWMENSYPYDHLVASSLWRLVPKNALREAKYRIISYIIDGFFNVAYECLKDLHDAWEEESKDKGEQ